MTEKGTEQQSIGIMPIPYHNDNPLNSQLEKTGIILVALQPKYPLHSVVYLISEAKSSTSFNLLIIFKRYR